VALKVDVIVAVAVAASLAAREATARIPIVMQLARKSRQAIQYASSVTPVYLNGLAVDVAQLTQAIHERRVVLHHTGVLFRNGRENSDQPQPILLRARGERKTGRTAEKRHELAPSHWTPNGKRLVRVEV
jgi:hypothetical protein